MGEQPGNGEDDTLEYTRPERAEPDDETALQPLPKEARPAKAGPEKREPNVDDDPTGRHRIYRKDE